MAASPQVPKGRPKTRSTTCSWTVLQPSLRDGIPWTVGPSVETLGYSHGSPSGQGERSEFGDGSALGTSNDAPIYPIQNSQQKWFRRFCRTACLISSRLLLTLYVSRFTMPSLDL